MRIHLAAIVVVGAAVAGCGSTTPWAASPIQGASFIVQPPMAAYVKELDEREQREQVRDWAVIGTVAHMGATPEQAAAATYELPPARLPYLENLYSFEYSHGRRVYLGKRVLLFRDSDDPDPQATLGRLADRVRMENGELPPTVEVYLINDLRDHGTILVDRVRDATHDELFSPMYGYIEGEVRDAASLTSWLAQVDDLTFASVGADGRMRLGGRRFPHTRTANLTTEDVAALYQAHEELYQPRAKAGQQLAALPTAVKTAAEHAIALAPAGDDDAWWGARLAARDLAAYEDQGATLQAIDVLSQPVQSPGFSLDPEWLPDPRDPTQPLILSRLRAFAEDPCRELRAIVREADALEKEQPDVTRQMARADRALDVRKAVQRRLGSLAEVCRRIQRSVAPRLREIVADVAGSPPAQWNTALAPYYQLHHDTLSDARREGFDSDAWLTFVVLDFYIFEMKVQCGRYTGLAGTRVAMTMFYTDLAAKLWEGTDYGLSAPVIDVPGFLSAPRLNLPAIFHDHVQEFLGTRLWFGVRASGVSRLAKSDRKSFAFDHRFTRVYAAGHDDANPGVEAAPPEDSRRTIGWWDHHYDDVADYEQEYHRLNQISKWSLVTAALVDSVRGSYLRAVAVRKDLEFVPWYEANGSRLRFSEPLPVAQAEIPCKECLPIISSYSYWTAGVFMAMYGGVSTAARDAPAKVPTVDPAAEPGARLPHGKDLGAGRGGTATHAVPERSGSEVTFKDAESVVTRSNTGDVSLGKQVVRYRPGATPDAIDVHAGDVGTLEMKARSSEVDLQWTDGEVEQERIEAPARARTIAEADELAAHGYIREAAPAYERAATPARAGAPKTAADLAREAIAEAAHGRALKVLEKVKALEGQGRQLSAELKDAVANAVGEIGTPASRAFVEEALQTGKPLTTANGGLAADRGQVVMRGVVRDIEGARPAARRTTGQVRPNPAIPKDAEFYLDEQFRSTRDGNLPQLGGDVSRLVGRPDVTVEVLERSEIGSVDRIVDPATRRTYDRIYTGKEAGGTAYGRPIVLIRRSSPMPANQNSPAVDHTVAVRAAGAAPGPISSPAPSAGAPVNLSSSAHPFAPVAQEPPRRAAGCAR